MSNITKFEYDAAKDRVTISFVSERGERCTLDLTLVIQQQVRLGIDEHIRKLHGQRDA